MKKSTRKSSTGAFDAGRDSRGNFSTRFSLPSFVKRVKKLTDDQRTALEKMGFGNLLLMPNHRLSKNLLVELMERWCCEKHAFKILPSEIPITLMDVALILGLRVVGKPVLLKDNEPFTDLEREYGAVIWKRKITVASLESRLDSLGGIVNEDFIRTFLLFTFGTFLFPNTNGKVNSCYLSFLKNLDDVCQYAWGAAVLEDISNWLSKRKEFNVEYVGGCLIFLQIWCYEHIDIARPSLLNSCLNFPRVCRWDNSRSHDRHWLTTKFKDLQDHQVIRMLQLTSGELEVDIIKELMEAQYDWKELPRLEHSSTYVSVVNGDNLRNRSQMMDCQVVRVEIESDNDTVQCKSDISIVEIQSDSSTVNEADMVHEVNLEQLKTLENVPVVVTKTMEFPSTSHCMEKTHKKQMELALQSPNPSTKFTFSDGDNSRTRIHILEEQNMELEKEMDKLRRENILLRNQLLSSSQLEEQNVELKKEVDYLRKENQSLCLSSNNLLLRLERLLLDEDANATEGT